MLYADEPKANTCVLDANGACVKNDEHGREGRTVTSSNRLTGLTLLVAGVLLKQTRSDKAAVVLVLIGMITVAWAEPINSEPSLNSQTIYRVL
jgi:hypothetical protein